MSWQTLNESVALQPGTKYFLVGAWDLLKHQTKGAPLDTGKPVTFVRIVDPDAATRAAGGVPMSSRPKGAVFKGDFGDVLGDETEKEFPLNGSFSVHPVPNYSVPPTMMAQVMRGALGDPYAAAAIAKKGYGRRKTRRPRKTRRRSQRPPRSRRTK